MVLHGALQSPAKHRQGGKGGTSHPAVPLGLVFPSCSAPLAEGCAGQGAGGHICTPRLAPAQGGGEQALLCECWAQGSSIVYSQYLSWPGSPAGCRKWGRGRAPNILCIPGAGAKAARGTRLGVTQCERGPLCLETLQSNTQGCPSPESSRGVGGLGALSSTVSCCLVPVPAPAQDLLSWAQHPEPPVLLGLPLTSPARTQPCCQCPRGTTLAPAASHGTAGELGTDPGPDGTRDHQGPFAKLQK